MSPDRRVVANSQRATYNENRSQSHENGTHLGLAVPSSAVHAAVESRLRDHDARYTKGRRAVVAALTAAKGPLSAAELAAAIGSAVPLSSLYRSLTVLEAAGVVAPHFSGKGLTRHELAEWLLGHHHHLVCVDCGSVEDVSLPPSYETQIGGLIEQVSRLASFRPLGHVFEIEGRCADCA